MDALTNDLVRHGKRAVEYFWDRPVRNDDGSGAPIWCLSRRYDIRPPTGNGLHSSTSSHASQSPSLISRSEASEDVVGSRISEDKVVLDPLESSQTSDASDEGGWPSAFLDDFETRIWMTYRSDFSPIPKSQDPKAAAAMTWQVRLRSQFGSAEGFTSDTGWGCMIRSGQSMLANSLTALRLGRGKTPSEMSAGSRDSLHTDWRRGENASDERQVLSMFADDPRAPFSIHRFVEHGAAACGTHPGAWFGPSATARCIQALTNQHKPSGLRVYITGDGSDVYEDLVMKLAKAEGEKFQPTLVLVGIRLGIERITPVYWKGLQDILRMPQSVGIAGGRPSASHYFVGTQGDNFFYLDPHYPRPALPFYENAADYTDAEISSCHTRKLKRIHIRDMDPSMLIGFLIRDEDDWKAWRKSVSDIPKGQKAIIHVADKEPSAVGGVSPRESAIDEVETFDDEENM